MSVSVSVNVPTSTIRDLLIGAIEGGSNYWGAFREDPNFIKSITESDKDAYVESEGGEYYARYDIENPNYCLRVSDSEGGTTYNVTLENFIKGLGVMSNRYPRHFKDVITENHDAETSDVFIQCAVFGEIVFG